MMQATLRRWHAYVGLFTAPTLLFFSLTGALQVFSFHESHGSYEPPAIIEKLSSVHKDQVFAFGHHDRQPPGTQPAGAPPPKDDDDDHMRTPTLALKIFFFWVAVALAISTLMGVWVGVTRPGRKCTGWTLLAAGTLIPVVLLLL